MFTGIIESIVQIQKIEQQQTNLSFWIKTPLVKELKIDQSVCHNGVCLTVEDKTKDAYKVTLVKETLDKTNFKNYLTNEKIPFNIERCLKLSDRLDGHFLQGHIDTTAKVKKIENKKGSWEYTLELPSTKFKHLMVEKGSIAINGISLTCFNVTQKQFTVAIIPHTYKITNMSFLKINSLVNIEFDIIGKYILKNKIVSRLKK